MASYAPHGSAQLRLQSKFCTTLLTATYSATNLPTMNNFAAGHLGVSGCWFEFFGTMNDDKSTKFFNKIKRRVNVFSVKMLRLPLFVNVNQQFWEKDLNRLNFESGKRS